MSNLPANRYTAESLVALGFTDAEAKVLCDWVDQGKPGLAATKSASFASMYAVGFSCQDIASQFPAFPLALLLYSRVRDGWDLLRAQFEARVTLHAPQAAQIAKNDATQLLSEIVKATNVKWRTELMQYLADPENVDAPGFLPDSVAQYQKIIDILKGLTETAKPSLPAAGAMVNVNVGQGGSVKVVSSQDVEQALMADLQGKPTK